MTGADRTQSGLPAEATRLVGRRAELERLAALSERARLVTVTGVGGVGKTRLALRAAAEATSRHADGAVWVALSGIEDGAALPFAIAEALPLHDQSLRPMIDVVADYLAGRELLLVLDTCEHLVDTCALTTAALLAAAPGLRILATSRRPLGLDEEVTFSLEPFPVTGAGAATGDAVALLADRAAAVAPGLAAETAGEQAVRLCRRLDGLPLAIELAAARLADMPIGELIDRLDDRFALLGDEQGDAAAEADPPWHQALRTAIGWSHELCSAPERLLWARVSVFAGGFDADAVVRVCADDRLPGAEIPGLLAGLAEKSVLLPAAGEPVTRFRMLDTIREYGAFWLRGLDEEWVMRSRHRDHFLEMAREGDAGWFGPGQVTWYQRVTTEHDNLRAALDFSLSEPENLVALDLAGALWFMWYPYGFLKEGRRYLELALAADERPSVPRNRAEWALGLVLISMGDPDGVQRAGERCASGAEAVGDPQAAVHARTLWVGSAILCGDLPAVMTRSEPVLAELSEGAVEGKPISLPVLLPVLMRGIALLQLGRPEEAVRGLAELRYRCERAGEHWMRAYGDVFRAQAELALGRPAEAATFATSAMRAKRWLHDHTGLAISVDVLSSAADALGRHARTARLLGLSQQIWESVGRPQAGVPEWVATREACEGRARAALGEAGFEAAFAAGYQVGMDDGIEQVLEEPITAS